MSTTRTFTVTAVSPTSSADSRLLCPTTALFTVPFTLYSLLLSHRVSKLRLASNSPNALACCGPTSPERRDSNSPTSDKKGTDSDPLYLATRAHANYLENVPMALLISAIAELNGANRKVLGWALAGLAVMRIVHVEVWLRRGKGVGIGGMVGHCGTGAWFVGMVGWCTVLVRDFWGF